MKINKNKKYIIVVLIILLIITIVSIKSLMKDNNKSLPETNEINNLKRFAVMVQNETGYEEYISKDNKWPSEGYKFKEAKCVDNKGSKIDSNIVKYNNGKVTLTTNKTVYCTLYFDKKTTINALDIVASKPKSLSPNPDQGDMYRYQGTSELVNDNYICFGTDNKEKCTNDKDHYMYRIIGITPEGEMKLIKQTPVVEEGNIVFNWFKPVGFKDNGSPLYGTAEKGVETWPESAIFQRLNGLSNGTTTGAGQDTGEYNTNPNNNADTDIFVDSSEYEYLKSGDSINGTKDNKGSEWYQLIVDHEWMYGSTEDSFNFNGHEMYKAETGQLKTTHYYLNAGNYDEELYMWNKETDKVTAKISLPYLHDIYLAYYDGETEETRGIPGKYPFEFWIGSLSTISSMTLIASGMDLNYQVPPTVLVPIRIFSSSGEDGRASLADTAARVNNGLSALPVFYLPNTIEMEGSGLETDPYRILN